RIVAPDKAAQRPAPAAEIARAALQVNSSVRRHANFLSPSKHRMHKREQTLLFSEYDLRLILEAQLKRVGERVLAIPKERFEQASDEFLAAEIASVLIVTPL